MKILIIEDDKFKSEQLYKFVEKYLPDAKVQCHRSYQSGLLAVEEFEPNLILLDMVIPNYDQSESEIGFDVRLFGGVDVLREVKRECSECDVIIVTQFEDFGEGEEKTTFEELKSSLAEEYTGNYVGAVYYHPTRSDWIPLLRDMIFKCRGEAE